MSMIAPSCNSLRFGQNVQVIGESRFSRPQTFTVRKFEQQHASQLAALEAHGLRIGAEKELAGGNVQMSIFASARGVLQPILGVTQTVAPEQFSVAAMQQATVTMLESLQNKIGQIAASLKPQQ